MSVPIFQKGEVYTLKEIIKIIDQTENADLESYMNLEFEVKSINQGKALKDLKGVRNVIKKQ